MRQRIQSCDSNFLHPTISGTSGQPLIHLNKSSLWHSFCLFSRLTDCPIKDCNTRLSLIFSLVALRLADKKSSRILGSLRASFLPHDLSPRLVAFVSRIYWACCPFPKAPISGQPIPASSSILSDKANIQMVGDTPKWLIYGLLREKKMQCIVSFLRILLGMGGWKRNNDIRGW